MCVEYLVAFSLFCTSTTFFIMEYIWFVVILFSLIGGNLSTNVNQCPGENIANLEKHVIIRGCDDPPCHAKRKTQLPIKFKFTADSTITELIQEVSINLSGINLPFLGVDGVSACDYIYEADEKTKNHCKFVKDKSYIYINNLNILPVFPKVTGMVHWALNDPATKKHVFCLEAVVKIVD